MRRIGVISGQWEDFDDEGDYDSNYDILLFDYNVCGQDFFQEQKSRKCGIKFVRVGQVVLRLLERTELVSE